MSRHTNPEVEQMLRSRAPSEKRCRRCGKTKPQEEFSISFLCADGLDTYCKTCRRELWRQRRGGVTHLLARFTTEELEAEVARRHAAEKQL